MGDFIKNLINKIQKNIYTVFLKYLLSIIILLFFSCSHTKVQEYDIQGKVTKIVDGDTLYVLNEKDKNTYKVRIADIDAPEIDQNFGLKSKNFLYNRIYHKLVIINKNKKDKYGRILTNVVYNNRKNNIAEELLKNGLARVWKFSKNKYYKSIELNAKNNKIGIWSSSNNIDPYLWRKKINNFMQLRRDSNPQPSDP